MALLGEILVEPFVAGSPGEHVKAAWLAAEVAGASLEVGPFGTIVRARSTDVLLGALDAALRAALAHGATRVSCQVAYD